jgi:hypothetical protein
VHLVQHTDSIRHSSCSELLACVQVQLLGYVCKRLQAELMMLSCDSVCCACGGVVQCTVQSG